MHSLTENNLLIRKNERCQLCQWLQGSANLVCLRTVLYVTGLPIGLVDVIQPRVYCEALRFAILRLRFDHLFIDSAVFVASLISAAT